MLCSSNTYGSNIVVHVSMWVTHWKEEIGRTVCDSGLDGRTAFLKGFNKGGPHQCIKQQHENYACSSEQNNNQKEKKKSYIRILKYTKWAWPITVHMACGPYHVMIWAYVHRNRSTLTRSCMVERAWSFDRLVRALAWSWRRPGRQTGRRKLLEETPTSLRTK